MQMLQLHIVIGQNRFQLFGQLLRTEQIHHADGPTGDFVLVSRTDAATGRADFAFASGGFARLVQSDMVRQNQRTGRRDFQTAFHVFHAGRVQFVDFAQQRLGGNDHAGADEAIQPLMQDAARNQAQHGFFTAHHQSVPCIVAALKTHDTRRFFRQPVDDFTLTLVAPLGADYHYIFSHSQTL